MVEISCVLSAILFTAANVMKILYYVRERRREHFDIDLYKSLDPEYLQEDWDFRLSKKALFLSSGFLNALAWTIFAYPCVQLAWLLSNRGSRFLAINVSIALLAFCGGLTEWLSQLFWIGMNVASTQLVVNFNLENWVARADITDNAASDDGMGWRSLEINHVVGSGFIWFTDAFEWLCLSGIFIFAFVSVRKWRTEDTTSFGARWNGLGLFIGLLALLEFVAEILRFEGFRSFGPVVLIYAMLNRLLLMPAWIIALGFMLPKATMKQSYSNNHSLQDAGDLALTEMREPHFTIGDEDQGNSGSTPAGRAS